MAAAESACATFTKMRVEPHFRVRTCFTKSALTGTSKRRGRTGAQDAHSSV